jgi:Cof subfamily protein (haloacid dehalogenase superfamily)
MTFSSIQPAPGIDLSILDDLFAGHGPRLAHMRDAGAVARDLGRSLSLPPARAGLLMRSALLHDIGYAPALHRFSFHALDGALFLADQGEHPWVVEAVLRHSQADRKAPSIPGVAEEYAARPALVEANWLVRLVTVADWRSAGVGGRVSFGQRLQDILRRNPDNPGKARRATDMVAEVRDWFLESARGMGTSPLPWIFCDVDNTLIRPGDGLSPSNRAAIRAYVAGGGRFSLATGKHPRSIVSLIQDLGLGSAQVAANGTCLLERGRITVLAHLGEAAQALRLRLEALGLPLALYREDGIEAGGAWEGWMDDVFDRYGEIRPLRGPQSGPVLKILGVVDDTDPRREQALRDLAVSVGAQVCRSDRHFLEFVPHGGDKGRAVCQVTEKAGWPLLHTLALGDTENDAAMFAQCGACAAVANATDEARLGADWVVPACTEDGVGRLLHVLRQGGGWRALSSALHISAG